MRERLPLCNEEPPRPRLCSPRRRVCAVSLSSGLALVNGCRRRALFRAWRRRDDLDAVREESCRGAWARVERKRAAGRRLHELFMGAGHGGRSRAAARGIENERRGGGGPGPSSFFETAFFF